MAVTVDSIQFDSHEYDDRGDVLYLSVGEPRYLQRLTQPQRAMPSTSTPVET